MRVLRLLEVGVCGRTVFYYVDSLIFSLFVNSPCNSRGKTHEVYLHVCMLVNILFKSLYVLSSLIHWHY